MESDWDKLTVAGFAVVVGGLGFTARYWMRALALPHTYDDALLLGAAITVMGVLLAFIGLKGRQRSR